jgi:hypothetical protein
MILIPPIGILHTCHKYLEISINIGNVCNILSLPLGKQNTITTIWVLEPPNNDYTPRPFLIMIITPPLYYNPRPILLKHLFLNITPLYSITPDHSNYEEINPLYVL